MLWLFGLLSNRLMLYAAGFMAIALVASGIYLKGRMDCGNAVRVAELEAQLVAAKRSMEILRRDKEAADIDNERLAELEKRYYEMEDALIDGECFTDAESERLRGLWNLDTSK